MAPLRQAEASMPGSQSRTSVISRCFQQMTRNAPAESAVCFCLKQCLLKKPERAVGILSACQDVFQGEDTRVSQHYFDRQAMVWSFGLADLCC